MRKLVLVAVLVTSGCFGRGGIHFRGDPIGAIATAVTIAAVANAVATAPPVVVNVEYYGPEANPGNVWVNGQYVYAQQGWVWQPGHWQPERPGYTWVQGAWVAENNQYVWHDGYWAEPRAGFTYVDGYWDYQQNGYVWIPGTWEADRPGYLFIGGGWQVVDGHRTWIRGSWQVDDGRPEWRRYRHR
jgi:hypothetical protein